ncbi:MAG: hypothetical protein KKA62_04060 [Nanoarchaeota archaeon]|nr:hypothetical protein [Nanoarchaeota archaeon]MBU1977098.1 hypothetical protein [Nanoarchaeota archaeon]
MDSYSCNGCSYGKVRIVNYASTNYAQSVYSPKRPVSMSSGCTCFGQGCRGTCRI